jgi:hypothetical protein
MVISQQADFAVKYASRLNSAMAESHLADGGTDGENFRHPSP